MALSLEAGESVVIEGEGFIATSDMPWLTLKGTPSLRAGRWIKLVYEASLLEKLCRPILRFGGDFGHHDEILPAPLFGRGIWYGRVPSGTREMAISPTNQVGQFHFRISSFEPLSPARLAREAFAHDPRRLARSIGGSLIGQRYDAAIDLRNCFALTPMSDYSRWRAERARPVEPKGLDLLPQIAEAATIHVVSLVAGDLGESAEKLLHELRQQSYQNWTLSLVHDLQKPGDFSSNDERVRVVADGDLAASLKGCAPCDMTFFMQPGDSLPPYALAAISAEAIRKPSVDVFYGDEEFDQKAGLSQLKLRPDWSPILSHYVNYLGSAVFFRTGYLGDGDRMDSASRRALDVDSTAVAHIRRVLVTRSEPSQIKFREALPAKRIQSVDSSKPIASIIIPTRDRAALLRKCVEGVRRSIPENFEVIVVDNSSTNPDALALLASLAADSRFQVISHPGAFNFSAMCNAGARLARGSILVLLNNDIEMIESDWLAAMLDWASNPRIGAVGAKLLYPDGRVQHSGVVLGLHGHAGHYERMLKPSDVGYFGTLCSPHEVSAVTGACLAVEKSKFDQVGGLDAANLPVDLNDIDLCLRLREAGFTNLMEPRAVLIHKESASRRSIRDDRFRYDRERRYFRARWQNALRDDPYFHPALSIYTLEPALG